MTDREQEFVNAVIRRFGWTMGMLRKAAFNSADEPSQREADEHFRGWSREALVRLVFEQEEAPTSCCGEELE